MNAIITRFAPSPTGYLHIGGIRTALLNYLISQQAKKKYPNSKFLLRIEDTDKLRSKNEFNESIINGLEWIGIKWDGKHTLQSEKIERHKEVANKLLIKGFAFKCICSPEDLEKRRKELQNNNLNNKRICISCEKNSDIQKLEKDYCVRIKVPNKKSLIIKDKIQGKIEVNYKEIDNFILLRLDSSPTYMLSVVVDDHDMGVNYVLRGDDHLNNSFRQQIIYNYLDWETPSYAHIPLIHGSDGSKLSKRHGAIDINEFKKYGYLPQALINYLILLGWSPKKNNEFIEIEQILEIFEINDISKSSSIFDYDKLNHFNNYYLKKDENKFLFENYAKINSKLMEYMNKDKEKVLRIFEVYKKNLKFYLELENICNLYFDNLMKIKEDKLLNRDFNLIIKDFLIHLNKIKDWKKTTIEESIDKFIKLKGIKFFTFGKPLRIVMINSTNGPSISDIFYILGKESTFLRLNKYINSN